MNVYHYKAIGKSDAKCGLDIIEKGSKAIVMLTELPDNPGTSVTNWYEEIAAKLFKETLRGKYGIKDITWIEHYPFEKRTKHSDGREETWDKVTMDWNGDRFMNIKWRPLKREEVENLGIKI